MNKQILNCNKHFITEHKEAGSQLQQRHADNF
jgi:hypothetical protein